MDKAASFKTSSRVRASDPDSLDKVVFRLVEAEDKSASIDPATGKLRWTPREPGRYDFTVEAIDETAETSPEDVRQQRASQKA